MGIKIVGKIAGVSFSSSFCVGFDTTIAAVVVRMIVNVSMTNMISSFVPLVI
jgi:hypothetical protein